MDDALSTFTTTTVLDEARVTKLVEFDRKPTKPLNIKASDRTQLLQKLLAPSSIASEVDEYGIPRLFAESISFEEEQTSRLTRLMAAIFVCILQESVDTLGILGHTYGVPMVDVEIANTGLANKCEKLCSHSLIFDPSTMVEYKSHEGEFMLKKLQCDRGFLQKVLEVTVTSLQNHDNYAALIGFLKSYQSMINEEEVLLRDVEIKKTRLAIIKEHILCDKHEYRRRIEGISASIGRARDEIENSLIQEEIKLRYLSQWECSRQQLNKALRTNEERFYKKTIKTADKNIVKESRVHFEICNFMNEYITDLEISIQDWMTKYETDLEEKEEELLKVNVNVESITEDLEKLRQTYEQHAEEIRAYLEYKAEKKRLADFEILKEEMAIVIQRWWREVMKVKGLGPYRKKKGKGKNDKKKKKK